MGYTSEATMNEQGLRDVERWKDKIEVRLDNRQVFFLFFGSALVACLLFVLGVIVGKRLESRGRAAAPEIEDPLALLDKVAASTRAAEPAAALTKTPPARAAGTRTAKASVAPTAKAPEAAERTESRPADLKVAARPAASADKPIAEAAAAPLPDKTARAERPADKTTAAAPEAPKPQEAPKADPSKAAAADKAIPVAKAAASPPAEAAKTTRFTLQIGAFPDLAEAEAFAQQYQSLGKPYVVPSEIPQKGTWYRVRVGDFASQKEAVDAKVAFEKQHNRIALVAPR
jgi:cell division protein FtsN